ncbi:unnamed protein product, partial [Rotaria sp. Silwood2]
MNDNVLQLSNCTFDAHFEDINAALARGAQLSLLKPGGQLNFDYLTKTIDSKEVTYIGAVPSWLSAMGKFLKENSQFQGRMRKVRIWYLGGEQLLSSMIAQVLPFIGEQSRILNGYGPAETTIAAISYEVHREQLCQMTSIPIGRPLDGYRIYLLDEYRQPVPFGQQGEIMIGGVGVFVGYHERADLTAKSLIDINGELYYATGDLARFDVKLGELFFIGRRDYQVKIRGQRVELSTIESVILRSSSYIMNCMVLKEGSEADSYLTAYIHVTERSHVSELRNEIKTICQSQLPSYMVPSKWLLVSEFPLNSNNKVDRKRLMELDAFMDSSSDDESFLLSPLEKKLQDIFIRTLQLKKAPDVRMPFGQLGGTSLGAMHALMFIREELYDRMDISVLFANPSVRELAVALDLLLSKAQYEEEEQEKGEEDFSIRPRSSWFVETVGILLLAFQWLLPIFVAARLDFNVIALLLVPFIHLLQYPIFMKLFGGPLSRGRDTLYSWRYYHLWFLRRQWKLNSYWLGHLLGTRLYNSYLSLCGARITDGAHIYTTQIDAPWLLEVGDATYIGDEVVLSSLTYHDRIYDLHEVYIGSHCSIGARCVLHDGVRMHDGVLIEPSTNITGQLFGKDQETPSSSCTLSYTQSFFQLASIYAMIHMQILALKLSWYGAERLPMYLNLPVLWLTWAVFGTLIGLLLLRYVVGHVLEVFSESLNSWNYLRCFWLRRLVVNSFGPCFSAILDTNCWILSSALRWLGASLEHNNIEIVNSVNVLAAPSNLLFIEKDVTITSDVCFLPYDVTIEGQCVVNGPIRIGSRSFLGDSCIIRSGVNLPEDIFISSSARIDLNTFNLKK